MKSLIMLRLAASVTFVALTSGTSTASGTSTTSGTPIEDIVPTHTPSSIPDAISTLSSIFSAAAQPTGSFNDAVVQLVENDFTPGNLHDVERTYSTGCNSVTNDNTKEPTTPVFPQKSTDDALYTLTEAQLREVIQIPATFTFGQKPPVIMVPGTGSTGCLTYGSNYIKLWSDVSYADPVWLNIPHFLNDDAQVNAEYVAYALNYISGISSNANISVIAWSQGNLDTQWALKYWPSTRKVTSDFINISADFGGALLGNNNSNFIATLRSDGGDSAYVPQTSIYSATDELVQQSGADASGIINNARGVGATNNEVQAICKGQPAGGFYTHAGVLYNALAFALAVDALTHDGPGEVSRLDLATVCSQAASPGLSLNDILVTEGSVPFGALAIAAYEPKTTAEPPIMSYAA